MSEVPRILRSGARFVFTTWEKPNQDVPIDWELHGDYRLLLQDSGFVVEEYYEKRDWERRHRAVYERYLAEQATLIKEMGETAARHIVNEAKKYSGMLANVRHVLIVCRKI